MPEELNPDSFMAGLNSASQPKTSPRAGDLNPDSFMASRPAAPPAPVQSPVHPALAGLPKPDEAVQNAEINARQMAQMLSDVGRQMQDGARSLIPHDLRGYTPEELARPGGFTNPRTGKQSTVAGDLARVPVLDSPVEGGKQIVQGVEQAAEPGLRDKASGLHKVIGGAMEASTPLLAAGGLIAPLETAGALAGGVLAQQGTEAGFKKAGVPNEYAELAGDAAGLVGGAAGGRGAHALKPRPALEGQVLPPERATLDRQVDAGPQSAATYQPQNPSSPIDVEPTFAGSRKASKVELQKPSIPQTEQPTGSARPADKTIDLTPDQFMARETTAAKSGSTSTGDKFSDGEDRLKDLSDEALLRGKAKAERSGQTAAGHSIDAEIADRYKNDPDINPRSVAFVGDGYVVRGSENLGKFKTEAEAFAAHVRNVNEKRSESNDDTSAITEPGREAQNPPEQSTQNAGGAAPEQRPDGEAEQSGESGNEKEARLTEPRAAAVAPAYGRDVAVNVPGEKTVYPARYSVREATDLQPSHNAFNFERNPDYDHENDRDYSNPENASRVIQNGHAGTYSPDYTLTESPTAEHGAPVIDPRGNALGGNSRTMTMQRVYEHNPPGAEAYRSQLAEKARQFGVDPAELGRFQNPVLVRELVDQPDSRTAQKAITDFNKTATAKLAPEEQAVSDGRRLSPQTISRISGNLSDVGEDSTLAQALRGDRGAEIVNSLVKDGVLTNQEKAGYLDEKGQLTPQIKNRIAKALVGRMFESSSHFGQTAPEIRGKLERIAPQVLRVEDRPEWALTGRVREAIGALADARAHGIKNLDDLDRQADIIGGSSKSYSPDAIAVARKLQAGPLVAAKAFRQYANDAEMSRAGSQVAFFEPPTRREAFDSAFGSGFVPGSIAEAQALRPSSRGSNADLSLASIDARYHAGTGQRNGRLYVNHSAIRAINSLFKAITRSSDDIIKPNADAVTIGAETSALLNRKLAEVRDNPRTPEAARVAIQRLSDAVNQGIKNDRQLAIAVTDHPASDSGIRTTIRHELIHREQSRLGDGNLIRSGVDSSEFLSHRLAQKAASRLRLAYGNDPEVLSTEIPAYLGSGNYETLGLDRAGAIEVLAHYFGLLFKQQGDRALSVLAQVNPGLRKALYERDERFRPRQANGGPATGERGGADRPGEPQAGRTLAESTPLPSRSGARPEGADESSSASARLSERRQGSPGGEVRRDVPAGESADKLKRVRQQPSNAVHKDIDHSRISRIPYLRKVQGVSFVVVPMGDYNEEIQVSPDFDDDDTREERIQKYQDADATLRQFGLRERYAPVIQKLQSLPAVPREKLAQQYENRASAHEKVGTVFLRPRTDGRPPDSFERQHVARNWSAGLAERVKSSQRHAWLMDDAKWRDNLRQSADRVEKYLPWDGDSAAVETARRRVDAARTMLKDHDRSESTYNDARRPEILGRDAKWDRKEREAGSDSRQTPDSAGSRTLSTGPQRVSADAGTVQEPPSSKSGRVSGERSGRRGETDGPDRGSLFGDDSDAEVARTAALDRDRLVADRLTAQMKSPVTREEQLKKLKRTKDQPQTSLFDGGAEGPEQGRLFLKPFKELQGPGRLSDAESRFRAPGGDESKATVYVNRPAMREINRAGDVIDGVVPSGTAPQGFAVTSKYASRLAEALHRKAMGHMPYDSRTGMVFAHLRDNLAEAAATGRPVVVIQAGPDRTLGQVKGVLYHERFHSAQRALTSDQDFLGHIDAEKYFANETALKLGSSLVKLGYPAGNADVLAAEAGAWLAGGQYGYLGLNRDEAIEALWHYFDVLGQQHGSKAFSLVLKVRPNLRSEVRARFESTHLHEGRAADARPGASRLSGDVRKDGNQAGPDSRQTPDSAGSRRPDGSASGPRERQEFPDTGERGAESRKGSVSQGVRRDVPGEQGQIGQNGDLAKNVRYVRFGPPPESGRSYNFKDKRLEPGVSVHRLIKHDGQWLFDEQGGSISTLGDERPLYEVDGDPIEETGSDGEPLLTNIRSSKRLKGKFSDFGTTGERLGPFSEDRGVVRRNRINGNYLIGHVSVPGTRGKYYPKEEALRRVATDRDWPISPERAQSVSEEARQFINNYEKEQAAKALASRKATQGGFLRIPGSDPDAAETNYSGLGALEDVTTRNLSQLRRADPKAWQAAVEAASAKSQTAVMMKTAIPKIEAALGGDHSRDEFFQGLVESRLQGIRKRWAGMADFALRASDENMLASQDRILSLLAHMRDVTDFSQPQQMSLKGMQPAAKRFGNTKLEQTAATLLENKDFDSLRKLLKQTFDNAARSVARIMPEKQFEDLRHSPKFQDGLQVYKKLIEKPIAESHESNEGVFSDALGPLDTYFPLMPVREEDLPVRNGSKLEYSRPENTQNDFATGFAQQYSVEMEDLRQKLTRAVKANTKASLIDALIDAGLVKPLKNYDSAGDGKLWYRGQPYDAVRMETTPPRTIIQNGKVTHQPANSVLVPKWLHKELEPILQNQYAKPTLGFAHRIADLVNTVAISGPADAIWHAANIFGTLVANTPFLGNSILGKASSAPFVKRFAAVVKVATTDPTTEQAAAELQEMAKLGLLPDRFGSETYSKKYAEQTGAKLVRYSMAPMLVGPKGIDVRARLVMYRLAKEINPDADGPQLHLFVNQLGNYVDALQGQIERSAKHIGLSPFATAGTTMLRNGINAWTGAGPMPSDSPSLRVWQQLTGGAVGLVALWALTQKQYTGKWPWEDKRSKLLQIPANADHRRSKLGTALWGKGPETGYINMTFFNPLVGRGARALGVKGAVDTTMNGGKWWQAVESAQKDIMNAFAHPWLGPLPRAAFVGLTGDEPSLTGLRDDRARFNPQLLPAVHKAGEGSSIAKRGLAAAKELNSFYGSVAANSGLGETPNPHDSTNHWVRMIMDLALPGLVANGQNPAAQHQRLVKQAATARRNGR